MVAHKIYKKNFLDKVIVHLAFDSVIDLSKGLPKQFSESLLKAYPVSKVQETVNKNIKISQAGVHVDENKGNQWQYRGLNNEKLLTLDSKFFSIQYNQQENYDVFKDEFIKFKDLLFNSYPELVVSRIGLRYINVIKIAEDNPLDWSRYINDSLISSFNFLPTKEVVSRAFHNLEFNFSRYNINFKYGMNNPDHPAPIKKKIFILDYDGYALGLQDKDSIQDNFSDINEKIYELFELSVKDGLREIIK